MPDNNFQGTKTFLGSRDRYQDNNMKAKQLWNCLKPRKEANTDGVRMKPPPTIRYFHGIFLTMVQGLWFKVHN